VCSYIARAAAGGSACVQAVNDLTSVRVVGKEQGVKGAVRGPKAIEDLVCKLP